MPGTGNLSLANILLGGSLTVSGSANTSCITVNGTISATGNGSISLTARNALISSRVSTQSGNISITADNGSFLTGTFAGIEINGTSASLNTGGGSINLKGRGGSGGSPTLAGICITQGSLYAGGTGGITILAQSANNTATGFSFTNGVIASYGGNIVFNANSVSLDPTNSRTNATGSGVVRFLTLGAAINLGGADDSANLGLTSAELGTITAGNLIIGRNDAPLTILNLGFESPSLGNSSSSYQYNVANGNWTFSGQAGMAANGSAFNPPTPPQGNQVTFIQNQGSTRQLISGFQNDTYYTLTYYYAGRPGYSGANPIQVSVGNANLGVFTPGSTTSYSLVTSSLIN
ncbi:MAG: hypothetical protein ACKO5E_00960, partial [bacterium]